MSTVIGRMLILLHMGFAPVDHKCIRWERCGEYVRIAG